MESLLHLLGLRVLVVWVRSTNREEYRRRVRIQARENTQQS